LSVTVEIEFCIWLVALEAIFFASDNDGRLDIIDFASGILVGKLVGRLVGKLEARELISISGNLNWVAFDNI
jgi:hypothetical protein